MKAPTRISIPVSALERLGRRAETITWDELVELSRISVRRRGADITTLDVRDFREELHRRLELVEAARPKFDAGDVCGFERDELPRACVPASNDEPHDDEEASP
jgi:hypothetical protein